MKSIEEQFIDLYGPVLDRWSDHIKTVCPKCFSKALACNTRKGLVTCFACGYGRGIPPITGKPYLGTEAEVDIKLQMSILEDIIPTQTLSDRHTDYLRQRGILNPQRYGICTASMDLVLALRKKYSMDQLIAAGFYSEIKGHILPSFALDNGRILIPYWSDSTIIGLKSRANPFDFQSHTQRYVTLKGAKLSKAAWYFNTGLDSKDLFITEGELKAVVATEQQLLCIGMSGVACWKAAIKFARPRIYKGQIERIFIVFDVEANKQKNQLVQENALQIQKAFPRITRILTLPLEGQKVDLDSFLVKYGAKELEYLAEDSWGYR